MDFFENRPESKPRRELPEPLNRLTERIIGAAIEVHRILGPGLPEAMYESALCHEFGLRGIAFERQAEMHVHYKGTPIGLTRIDLVVERSVILELKSCEQLSPVHRAQLITYLNITQLDVGLLINFNVPLLVDGIKRVIRTL